MKKSYNVTVGSKQIIATLIERRGSEITFEIQGERHSISIEPQFPTPWMVNTASVASHVTAPSESSTQRHTTSESLNQAFKPIDKTTKIEGVICSPLPGIVVALPIQVGATINQGDTVAVIEAMKMENAVPTLSSGRIEELYVKIGDELSLGQQIAKISTRDSSS
jgi:biotin carboxyl carrier protein